jgi:hypothetical protein
VGKKQGVFAMTELKLFPCLLVGSGVRMKEKRDGVGLLKKLGVFILFHMVFFGDVSKLYWRL